MLPLATALPLQRKHPCSKHNILLTRDDTHRHKYDVCDNLNRGTRGPHMPDPHMPDAIPQMPDAIAVTYPPSKRVLRRPHLSRPGILIEERERLGPRLARHAVRDSEVRATSHDTARTYRLSCHSSASSDACRGSVIGAGGLRGKARAAERVGVRDAKEGNEEDGRTEDKAARRLPWRGCCMRLTAELARR